MLSISAAVPRLPSTNTAVAALVIVNFAVGIWIAMHPTMAQEVSAENVSTAAGLLGGSGSLAGAVAIWAVDKVTRQTGSFAIPFATVAAASLGSAAAGYAVIRRFPASAKS